MKSVAIFLIVLYQHIFSMLFKLIVGVPAFCRFSPTCSQYTKEAIRRFGVGKGISLGLKRASKCHPFGEAGIDLLPTK